MVSLLALTLALASPPSVCPMTVGVASDGVVFSDRFYGWYKISLKTLESDLRGGCYNDANPSRVTSVRLFLAPGAPKPKIDSVLSVLRANGWDRNKIDVKNGTTIRKLREEFCSLGRSG
jgi:hypothetical protein